jgi:hypothetical protein
MDLKQLRRASMLLAEIKTTIATRNTWATDDYIVIKDNVECFCLLGAINKPQSQLMIKNGINFDEAKKHIDEETVETQRWVTILLGDDAHVLFKDRFADAPYSFGTAPIPMVNDHLGFNVVHELLDHTIARVTTMINNYEHSADPY